MNQQDELSDLIFESIRNTGSTAATAAKILAAGYSRPRVVETIDQLASLPDGVWIRDRAGDFGIKRDWPLDLAVHYPILGHSKTNATIPVPATVLYLPEEKP